VANVTFVGANPRNNVRQEDTYLTVQKQNDDGTWTTIRTDNDWTTTLRWARTNVILGTSTVTISWEIESDVESKPIKTI